jgi:hypothetical protein
MAILYAWKDANSSCMPVGLRERRTDRERELAMNDEQERLKRLRDRQLGDRDPQVKQRQIQRTITRKERKARGKGLTLKEAWEDVPQRMRGLAIGLLVGTILIFFLPSVWDSPWAIWVGVIAAVILVVLGVVIGNSLDLRDDLRDFMKH